MKAVIHPGDLNREQIVNSELEDEAATDRAEMMRRAAYRLEDRLRMLEAGLVAAHEEDELVEATPNNIRLRKELLTENERKKKDRGKGKVEVVATS